MHYEYINPNCAIPILINCGFITTGTVEGKTISMQQSREDETSNRDYTHRHSLRQSDITQHKRRPALLQIKAVIAH